MCVPSGINKTRAVQRTPLPFTEAGVAKAVSKHHSGVVCGAYIGIRLIALGSNTLIL
jgi:hypothetical protein